MTDHTLAIVFRNPHPQRSAKRTELYLFRRDGRSVHLEYANQGEYIGRRINAPRVPGNAVHILCWSLLRTEVGKALGAG